MCRYYFTVVWRGGRIVDDEGTELQSLEAARVEAIKDARALMSSAALVGLDISGRRIEIEDERGAVLLSVSFSEAITREE